MARARRTAECAEIEAQLWTLAKWLWLWSAIAAATSLAIGWRALAIGVLVAGLAYFIWHDKSRAAGLILVATILSGSLSLASRYHWSWSLEGLLMAGHLLFPVAGGASAVSAAFRYQGRLRSEDSLT